MLRIPQRTIGRKLDTGVVCVTQVFKNKQIINVFANTAKRYEKAI